MRQLHLGGKQAKPGWEILDIEPRPEVDHIGDAADLSRFSDATFKRIYASHILEHFGYRERLPQTLKEWRRVLVPGGELLVSVPDMETLASLFLKKDQLPLDQRFLIMRMMFGGQTNDYDFHYVGFDQDILVAFLHQAGFSQFQRVPGFNLFADASRVTVANTLISLNLVATK